MDNENQQSNSNFILGIKLKSSQFFANNGKTIPVTLIQAGPCTVTQIKTIAKDGYNAIQLGFLAKKVNHSLMGHFKKHINQTSGFKYLREFLFRSDHANLKEGDEIKVSVFKKGDMVNITGISKAKGFQGTVKRHHFKGASKTHGTKHAHRQPGSIGSTDAAKVFKGKKMAGRMGGKRVTIKNLEIVEIDKENNLLAIKGAIPGSRGTLLKIRG